MAKIKKVAVANRGEIARRIISVCREMGLQSLLLYARSDTDNEAFRLADEQICIGPADPFHSYLNIEANIQGALSGGADALHPGYGFLSENPHFAEECENKGLIFIGPKAQSLTLLGNKILARREAQSAGLPILPGWTGDFKEQILLQKAKEVSYPLMIKASLGGGGRGLRLVRSEEELKQALPLVRAEALQNFNNSEIFLEKYLPSARHIELQIFVSADGEIFILSDRDCSVQRRHQKMIEEAPSSLPKKIKQRIYEGGYELCSRLDYRGAGTMEFLVQDETFYFLEMNTRIQVEHTVTEMIYGVDLVKAQILTAMGQPAFALKREELKPRGHSIQCRLCAEDSYQNFLPAPGPLLSCQWPGGKSIRLDKAYHTGDQISVFYDSLLAKLIVWENSRVRAIEKMKRALEETVIFGLSTNISFLSFLLEHKDFVENKIHIESLEKIQSSDWKQARFPLPEGLAREIFQTLGSSSRPASAEPPSGFNPWSDFLKKGPA